MTYASRLQALRAELKNRNLDGFLVPMADEYQSHYPPASAQRIAFLSGFTGSAGLIAVLADKAAFFTDSRYTLQAQGQLDLSLFTVFDSADKAPGDWLKENLQEGQKLGFDPWLHTASGIERLQKKGLRLEPVTSNPVDAIWPDRPAPPLAPVRIYDLAYAGESSADKRAKIAASMAKANLDAAILTDATSIAWLLNVRGGDVPHTPIALSYAILRKDGKVDWFIDARKITPEIPAHLGADVTLRPPEAFAAWLQELGTAKQRVRLDPAEAAFRIAETLRESGAELDRGDDPCALPKACKNPEELQGMRAAHRRDGAALARFLCWLDKNPEVSELDAAAKVDACRAAQPLFRSLSFDTIAASGPHGALAHYIPTEATNRKLDRDSFLLVDSGGQYLGGTTDVTRTIALGTPSAEMKDRFTRALKGHIALASIRFPVGTTGADLDVLARQYLWEQGLDYAYGTGHGVGAYLDVHEGPQYISRRSHVPLQPGMVLSNEPGFHKAGAYGLRIENLQTVVEIPEISGAERKFLTFQPLTLAPIDRRAIDVNLLTKPERCWLNAYHARVREEITPLVDAETAAWLAEATETV